MMDLNGLNGKVCVVILKEYESENE